MSVLKLLNNSRNICLPTDSFVVMLFWDDQNKKKPIYYVRKTLLESELRYTHLEQLTLALLVTAWKLWPYF